MLNEVKERVYHYNKTLLESNLVIQNFGNASERYENKIIIKPSGVNLQNLNSKEMSVVDMKTGVCSSELKPSVDEPTHRVLYQAFPEILSVVHTHSKFATSFAQANLEIKNYGTTHSDFTKYSIPCTEVISKELLTESYEKNTGKLIIKRLKELGISPFEIPGILVANHGVFSWGKDLKTAVKNAESIEYIANLAFNTLLIKPKISIIPKHISDLHHNRKHGESAYYGQS